MIFQILFCKTNKTKTKVLAVQFVTQATQHGVAAASLRTPVLDLEINAHLTERLTAYINKRSSPLLSSSQWLVSCMILLFLCPVLNLYTAADTFTHEALITSPSHSPLIRDTPLGRVSLIHILSISLYLCF